jgi:hypothetical protein
MRCEESIYCPILARARPEKLVIHARRRGGMGAIAWPVDRGMLVLNCPIFTLVLDETDILADVGKNVYYTGLDWKIPKNFRLVLTRKEYNYNDMARGFMRDLISLADMTILPLLARINVPLTVYLFRPVCPSEEHLERLRDLVDDVLGTRHRRHMAIEGRVGEGPPKPKCTIKRLDDYIEEGCKELDPRRLSSTATKCRTCDLPTIGQSSCTGSFPIVQPSL